MGIDYSGVSSIASTAQIMEAASEFAGVEVPVDFALDDVSQPLIEELKRIRETTGVRYSVHAPFRDLNIASRNDDIQRVAADHMLWSLDVAIELEARLLNVHPGIHGYFPASEVPEMKRRERQLFEALCRRGAPHGIDIAVENLIKTNVHFEDTWTMDGIFDLLREVEADNFGVCLDTGHAHQAGLSPADAITRLAAYTSEVGRSRPTLFQLHAHDNHGGPIDEHLPIGEGTIDWRAVCTRLERLSFDGWIVFENMGIEKQRAGHSAWQRYTS